MLGTLTGALEAREIRLGPDAIQASAAGRNEIVDGIVKLTRIDVHYTLRIPEGSREKVERALSRHREKCPTARSLSGAVAVEFTADIDEE
ncbi:MAG TPA: OsmC family protein [Longimicrobiales bacterium]|nr:OsmC family protein [Longimicrobiales bacterium]